MMPHPSLFDVTPIAEQLANGYVLLTPNLRLASRIRAAYSIFCADNGHAVVVEPKIYALDNWVDACWREMLMALHPVALSHSLLSKAQELLLWQQIIEESESGEVLLRPTATAQQLVAAYQTLTYWQQDIQSARVRGYFTGEDSAVLLSWIDEFDARCQQNNWLPTSRKVGLVLQAFQKGELTGLGDFLAVGFDDLSPLHQQLLMAAGHQLGEEALKRYKATDVCVVGCESATQEITAAAVWAKQRLRSSPGSRVAIIIPELAQLRQSVQRILQEVFEPDYQSATLSRRNLPFNFSAGYALAQAPIIHAAMQGLSLVLAESDIESLESILQSPFYCMDDDWDQVSELIILLRRERQFVIRHAKFRQLADHVSEKFMSVDSEPSEWVFAQALKKQANDARSFSLNSPRAPSEWVSVFSTLLDDIGWPGKRQPDSIEYQELMQWQQILKQFATLATVKPTLNLAEALALLQSLLMGHVFQPESPDSSLQVLGVLEAVGLQFDDLWLMSMSSLQWPQAPSPNPLLPFSLQREQRMPHATAEREFQYAGQLVERFMLGAERLVISYAKQIDDNPADVSQLFRHYPQRELTDILGRSLDTLLPLREIRRRHLASATLQSFEAGHAPVVNIRDAIRGGSAIFSSQSACPFKAFAQHRLALKSLDEPTIGLSASDRGSLLHRALELIWLILKDAEQLKAKTIEQQSKICLDAAELSLNELISKQPQKIGKQYHRLERERLSRLLDAWLNLERERSSFTVEGIEVRKTFRFAQLQLETRIDRVDRLSDGRLVVIDYKTGRTTPSAWWGDRPDEPQLPLYRVLMNEGGDDVGAVAFAQIRVDGCELKGVGDNDLSEPQLQWKKKVQTDAGAVDWSDLTSHWQRVLSSLAYDFINGVSKVEPKQPAKTCAYCHFSPLCRIDHEVLQ